MKKLRYILLLIMTFVFTNSDAQDHVSTEKYKQLKETILSLDSAFWEAYNHCDVDKMNEFLTDDLEFYHDKAGLTVTLATLSENVRNGLCGNKDWWLRREEVAGTVQVFTLENYGAIISGEHYFYINETGKKEVLDGWAKFTHVWRFQDNEWKMHRILSYDHKPAPRKKGNK